MKGLVPAGTRGKAHCVAEALGITMARYLELLIEQDVLDAHGRPLWADEAVPRRTSPLPGMEERHDAA